ncbi:MAG: ATP-binding cassette domain-containing protein [Pseudomonadota bacterium]
MYDACLDRTPYLVMQNLSLSVAGKRLIDVPALELSQSGITAIMGPNGAGKSLLLRLLHGLETADSGTIDLQTSRKAQALVMQRPVLLRRSTAANLRFVLKVRGRPLNNVDQLLARVGLARCSGTPARRLSGGEQQRLSIAQALATDPEVLLLDEPTASLDIASTRLIEDILVNIASEGTRVVIVTHDAQQAKRLAQDIVFMSAGQVIEHAAASSFFSAPKTAHAQAYLGGRLVE